MQLLILLPLTAESQAPPVASFVGRAFPEWGRSLLFLLANGFVWRGCIDVARL
jgi:hypothetical protein